MLHHHLTQRYILNQKDFQRQIRGKPSRYVRFQVRKVLVWKVIEMIYAMIRILTTALTQKEIFWRLLVYWMSNMLNKMSSSIVFNSTSSWVSQKTK